MNIPFSKMQAQGNDFVFIDYSPQLQEVDFERLAIVISNRRFGVGADGLIILKEHPFADREMIIYNSDGSRAKMCGSALRCAALKLSRLLDKDELTIITDSGLKEAEVRDGEATVYLGRAKKLQELKIEDFDGDLVDIGNLHYIIYNADLEAQPQRLYGKALNRDARLPEGVNIHFIEILSRNWVKMKIWENGAGETLACGTGAAAVLHSAVSRGLMDKEAEVLMPGGSISVQMKDDKGMLIRGGAEESFTGHFPWKI